MLHPVPTRAAAASEFPRPDNNHATPPSPGIAMRPAAGTGSLNRPTRNPLDCAGWLVLSQCLATPGRVGAPGSLQAINCRSPRIAERCGSRLTRIWAGLYTRPRMGTDTIQPDYRLPTSRAAADLAAPVLTAAPLMRVAHSRHASVRPTADEVGCKLHPSTPAGVAGTSIRQTMGPSVADQGGAN